MEQMRRELKQPPRRNRRRIAAVLVPAALLAVAASSYMLLKPDQVVAAGIGCYDAASESANVAIVSATGEDPVEVCGALWERGDIGSSSGTAPPLIACLNSMGAVAVFPTDGRDLCTDLGLEQLPKGYREAAARFVKMRDALVDEMYRTGTAGSATERNACLSEGEALEVARRVLQTHDFTDWSAEVATGDYRRRSCANALGFDDKSKTVLIIPTEKGIDPDPYGSH